MEKDNFFLWRTAFLLSILTILYNFIEGFISIYWGIQDDTLALFGFGLDSFVELISGVGIFRMVIRIKNNTNEFRDSFEKKALQITGTSFYLLSLGLLIGSFIQLYFGAYPTTTVRGSIIASISIVVMWWIINKKLKVGRALGSNAIIADANCTKACMHLSIVLLVSSIGYELFDFKKIDSLGSILISGIAFREGKECFKKALDQSNSCC